LPQHKVIAILKKNGFNEEKNNFMARQGSDAVNDVAL